MRTAIFDPEAFYPLRSLVEGPFSRWDLLEPLERFVRGIVLHDEMIMEIAPHAYDPEADEEAGPGPRTVITAYGPVLTGYESVLSDPVRLRAKAPDITLSPEMFHLAAELSNAPSEGRGSVFYKAHVEFIQRTLGAVRAGGSAICDGTIWRAIDEQTTSFPAELFAVLDEDWKEYARAADAGHIGTVVPPVLSIALSRAASRDRLCAVIGDLRDEWAEPRAKVWTLVDSMKRVATLREQKDLRQQLEDASRYFSPKRKANSPRPLRMLWNVVAGALDGAVTAKLASGGPLVGAAVGGVRAGTKAMAEALPDSLHALLHRGTFDLAARVRRGVMNTEPMPALLSKFLGAAEKGKLGL